MCGPAALALTAAAVTAVGTVYGGLQARAQGNYQAQVAEQNAKLSAESARQEQDNTRDAALQHYRKVAQLQGQQRVAMAAGGLDLGFGNAADLTADTQMLAREDARRIYDQGAENVRGFDIESSNFKAEGAAAKQKGNGAFVGSLFSAAGTALGGAQQYGQLRRQGFS
ncbi:virion core protein, T7 gp14 family [Sphingobium salicis]|uniref:virion core protein, T7 gp14 family n=1 Tax=Sphingobium sp. HT1-2 TaxID=3111640 RepID=UPI003C2FF540